MLRLLLAVVCLACVGLPAACNDNGGSAGAVDAEADTATPSVDAPISTPYVPPKDGGSGLDGTVVVDAGAPDTPTLLCTSNQECAVGTSCVDSLCLTVGCGPLASGGPNGTYGGPCQATGGDASDGMCLPLLTLGAGSSPECQFGWVCVPSGTATTTCEPSTASGMNAPPSLTCALGTSCFSTGGLIGTCSANCGPTDGGACPPQGLAVCATDGGGSDAGDAPGDAGGDASDAGQEGG